MTGALIYERSSDSSRIRDGEVIGHGHSFPISFKRVIENCPRDHHADRAKRCVGNFGGILWCGWDCEIISLGFGWVLNNVGCISTELFE